MALPADYEERVYAGVLGKIIGVYLGRPFEGWSYERIMAELGEITYYVHERRGVPLVVTDDDISGTFTFLRALPDYGNRRDLTARQVGQTWLNYLIEPKTVLWWGGMGNSTEHTAFLRLKHGIPAPQSGSIATNGQVVAEQIGAQIFIDGWAMVAPGDPELAADLARRAGSISHDGEALHGAQVVAAMEALAFVESDLQRLLDTAVGLIPRDSVIYRLIADLREWHAAEKDWRRTRERIVATYGYDRYGGNCHMVPNHALIVYALLHGDDDFQKSLMIVNTCGWDTDCNSGNVGCLLGIKNGLAGIDTGPDWRGPVADRMYVAAADPGRVVSDAVTETYHVVNVGRSLAGAAPVAPKGGVRYHFELPGAVQGFQVEDSVECRGVATVENVAGHSSTGQRSLAIRYEHLAVGRTARVATPTFIPADVARLSTYNLMGSPLVYPGQRLFAGVEAGATSSGPVTCCLYLHHYGADDALVRLSGPPVVLAPGGRHTFSWPVPDLDGQPVASVGLQITGTGGQHGCVYLDYLGWDGLPRVTLGRPAGGGTMWRRAWVDGTDHDAGWTTEAYRLVQNEGTGLLMQGTRDWTDYRVRATLTPHMAASCGIGVRVQGMRRYYALLLAEGGKVRLVKALDGVQVLAEASLPWQFGRPYDLTLEVQGRHLRGSVNGHHVLLQAEDAHDPLDGGAVALLCEVGRVATEAVTIEPV